MNIGKLRDIIHFGLMQETSDGMGGLTTSGIKPNMVIKLNDESFIWKIKDVIDPSGKGERLSFTAVRDVENAVLPPPTPPEPDDSDDEEEEDGD